MNAIRDEALISVMKFLALLRSIRLRTPPKTKTPRITNKKKLRGLRDSLLVTQYDVLRQDPPEYDPFLIMSKKQIWTTD